MKQITVFLIIVMLVSVLVGAQDGVPSVTVMDQVSFGIVTVPQVVSDAPGFIVIHSANEEGRPGPVIGFRSVNDGVSHNVAVVIDTSMATSTLFAMLHVDTGEVGVYEFGQVEGADGPARVDDVVVVQPFAVEIIAASGQYLEDNTLVVSSVVTAQDGFVVVHQASDMGGPGPVIGYTAITAGNNHDVMIMLDADGITPVVFPMLHVDTGEVGVYEFGQVEGADGPVRLNEKVAVMPVQINMPSMVVHPQIVSDTLVAASVVSEGEGWLVIHAASEAGGPGPVIGYTAVMAGNNYDVRVELDVEGLTPVVFPMLHVDTGEAGVYEFGQVEGADGPVIVGERPLVFPVNVAPSFSPEGKLEGNTLLVKSALIDAQGWLVIHSDDGDGKPGPVLGHAPLVAGNNVDIVIELSDLTDTLFPMLHYDTGEAGVYEFGQVEGADGPVRIGDKVVVGPMQPEVMESDGY